MSGSATVLHVDDDAGLRRLLEEVFPEAAPELEYVAVEGAQAALEALEELQAPIVLVLDRRLPQTDVWAFAEQVAEELDVVAVPTFVLSGSNDPKAVAEAYANGAAAYLEKPIDTEGFAEIARLLERYTHLAKFPTPRR